MREKNNFEISSYPTENSKNQQNNWKQMLEKMRGKGNSH